MEERGISRWENRKVLAILPRWSKTFLNNNVGKVLKTLEEKGANVGLYCRASDEDPHFGESFPRGKLLPFRDSSSLLKTLRGVRRLRREFPYDLILWTYEGYRENLVLAIQNLFDGKPYFIKAVSHIPGPSRSWKDRTRTWLFSLLPSLRASCVLVESGEIRDRAKQHYGNVPLYLFPNGVPVEKLRRISASFNGTCSFARTPYILYTGRIIKQKGVDLLIEAFSRLAGNFPEWRLNIVGPVWDEEYHRACLRLVREKGLAERVLFHPYTEGKDLYLWYHHAEFFVLPSREEGLANRIPEAMFFENAIVGFDVGQTRSMVTPETGILVPPGDVEEFARGMEELAQDPARRKKMGERARQIVTAEFDDDRLIPQLLEECGHYLPKGRA